jgi:segregation and condensation protein A
VNDASERDTPPAADAPSRGTPHAAVVPAGGAPPADAVPSRAAPPAVPGIPSRGTPGSVMVKLVRFEGPLDLLLHLIKRDEIDIYDIPIAHITQQYLTYIELMRSLDLDVAGEFLVMAATLMRIKAKMLLPLPAVGEEEEEGDPREELVQRLLEYRQFKEAAGTLKGREADRRLLFERGILPGEDEAGPLPLAPATLFDLLDALNRVMSRVPEQTVYEVQGDIFDVEDKMSLIARTVAEQGSVSFLTLMKHCRARAEVIVTFIALLELVKLGRIAVTQPEPFGDILIVARTREGSEADAPVESPGGA